MSQTFQLTLNGDIKRRNQKHIVKIFWLCDRLCNVVGSREEPFIPVIEVHIGLDILIVLFLRSVVLRVVQQTQMVWQHCMSVTQLHINTEMCSRTG